MKKCNSYRINSESSITNIINCNVTANSNRNSVIEAMKALRYQKSSLDHQKYSLERLTKSKSNLFCLLVSFDLATNYEFKGLYEINEEKNNVCKSYSTSFYPSTIEFSEIKDFFFYDIENKHLRKFVNEVKKLSADVHAISLYNKKPKKI